MTIRAIIWDIGGVIARTEDQAPRNQLARDLGVTRSHLERLIFSGPQGTLAQLGIISVSELWTFVRKELNLKPDELPHLSELFFKGDQVDYELVDAIRSLQKEYTTVILSNAWDDLRDLLKNQWKIADAFDEIFVSGEEGVKKPDLAIYEIVLKKLEIKAEEAVFIDDFIENIEAARKLGIQAIHFKNPEQALGDLRSLLSRVVPQ